MKFEEKINKTPKELKNFFEKNKKIQEIFFIFESIFGILPKILTFIL